MYTSEINILTILKEKIFQAWLNTRFIEKSGIIYIEKNMLDKAFKVKFNLTFINKEYFLKG